MRRILSLLRSISIHAAREGGDLTPAFFANLSRLFQSTPPVKAATERASCGVQPSLFQSTPPVKAATFDDVNELWTTRFQSTPPVKAATAMSGTFLTINDISIHAAREGGDD